jgi:hypothetical protein
MTHSATPAVEVFFGATCACGLRLVTLISAELAIAKPAEILLSLAPQIQKAIADFCLDHQALGHEVEPLFWRLRSLAKAGKARLLEERGEAPRRVK